MASRFVHPRRLRTLLRHSIPSGTDREKILKQVCFPALGQMDRVCRKVRCDLGGEMAHYGNIWNGWHRCRRKNWFHLMNGKLFLFSRRLENRLVIIDPHEHANGFVIAETRSTAKTVVRDIRGAYLPGSSGLASIISSLKGTKSEEMNAVVFITRVCND